jgi:hypothetical protein
VQVVGSRTGPHTGRLKADSDGQGGSFLPDHPFAAGETITVTTGLSILGSNSGTFALHAAIAGALSFQIAQPWGSFRTASCRSGPPPVCVTLGLVVDVDCCCSSD